MTEDRLGSIIDILIPLWPDTTPQLDYNNCWELLIAVILSAQTTDAQVNRVTPELFRLWPSPADLAEADVGRVAEVIHSTGFFRTKAANIVACARKLLLEHGGVVPDSLDALLGLPGVGRKTANLVVSACFGQPGIVVDTHVLRIARRLGLADTDRPELTERIIAERVDSSLHTAFSHALNRHGKNVCTARSPRCPDCALSHLCPGRQA